MNHSVFQLGLTFIGYALIILIIATVATRSTRYLSDFVLGGRRLSGPITALGAGASDMSGWLLMALPGSAYLNGIGVMWLAVALTVGQYFNWLLVAKRLRVFTEVANDSLTLPTYLSNRFLDEGRSLRIVFAMAIVVFFTIYSAAGFVSGATVLQLTFNMDYTPALWLCALVIIAYTAIGGFLAVSWVDFFQGILMFLALVVAPVVTILHLGGFLGTYTQLEAINPGLLHPFKQITTLGFISMLAWGLGYFGQPHILVRFMAVRHIKELPIARLICINWMAIAMGGAIVTGLVGVVYFSKNPLERQETVFIALSQALFNPWMAGVLLSAVLSAVMSTVSAMILMGSTVLAEDFYHGMFRKNATEKEYIWVNRILLLVLSAIAVGFAASPEATILKLVGFAWAGLGASFGPTILFSLFWRRMTRQAAFWGIFVGAASVITWGLLEKWAGGNFLHPDILAGFEILPGFLLSSCAILLVGLRTEPSAELLALYDRSVRKLKMYEQESESDCSSQKLEGCLQMK